MVESDRISPRIRLALAEPAEASSYMRHLGQAAFDGGGPPAAEKDLGEPHQGDASTAANLFRNLTEYAVESLLEDGSILPLGYAVPANGQIQSIGAPDFRDDEADQVIAEHIRAFAGGRRVVLAALCSEDASRHTKVPEERRVVRIRLEARGESPFLYFQPSVISDEGARLEAVWTESADPMLLAET